MIVYVETSAAAKLLFVESESARLVVYLDERIAEGDELISSVLLETELRRAAIRENASQDTVTTILDRLDILDVERSLFTQAGILAGTNLRSLDALHIAAAQRANADVLVSYDERQIDAARSAGLRTVSP